MNMQQPTRSLEDLRREIDEVDDAIHDLIMRRTALVAQVAAAKGTRRGAASSNFVRPGREAGVLRRLLARHRGPFPKPVLVRLWREIIAGPLALQGNFSVAVFAPEKEPGYWDLARDHYGGHTPFTAYNTPSQVIAALVDGNATIGVLPTIEDADPDPWWRLLVREDGKGSSIIARLPMAGSGNARGERLEALVLGRATPEATGQDHSYLVFEAGEEISRARLRSELAKTGLEPVLFATWQEPDGSRRLYLVELRGFVAEGDTHLVKFLSTRKDKIRRVFFLGSYAMPFAAKELAETKEG